MVSTAAPGSPGSHRLRPEFYEPDRVPPEVARYGRAPDTLAVGSPGKIGVLDLAFEQGPDRTHLVRQYQKSPLQIMRPLYFDPHRPDLAITFLMSTGGGVVQADRLRTDIHCGAGTAALFTTQAATKLHRMEFDYATHQVNLTAGPDAYVEYLPEPTIPFGGARFYQRTTVTADPSATVLVADTLLAGRLARGERHRYDVLATDLRIARPGGYPLAVDTVRLVPAEHGVTGPAVLGGHDIVTSFYVVTARAAPDAVADALHDALAGRDLLHGASVLPGDCGAWVRLVGEDPPAMTAALHAAWDAVRHLLAGVPAPHLRKP